VVVFVEADQAAGKREGGDRQRASGRVTPCWPRNVGNTHRGRIIWVFATSPDLLEADLGGRAGWMHMPLFPETGADAESFAIARN
jgi:hypothetical protein